MFIYDTNIKARALERDGSFHEAFTLIDDIIPKIKNKDLKYLALSYQTKASIEKELGKYQQSINTSNAALKISLQLKDTFNIAYNYNLIGIGYYFLSAYDSTKMYYEKSYELKKKIKAKDNMLAVSAYNLAILYEDLAQPEKALALYKDAEYYLLQNKDDKSFLSDIYVGIAHLYYYRKEINKAEVYSEKALDVGLISYGEFNPNMTFVYNSYANILEIKGKYKEAIVLLEKCLKIRENTYGKNHKWTCESNYKLAEVLALDKQYKKAEAYFKKAIVIGQKTNSPQYLANAQSYLAKMFLEQDKQYDESEKLLFAALDKNISVFGYKNDIIAENFYHLSKVAKKKKDKEKFFAFIRQTFNSSAYDKENINEVIAPFQVLDALVLMGEWYHDDYIKTNDINFLVNKFELIDQQLALIKHTQKNFSSDQSKINFANEYRKVFEKGLNTCWALYHKTKDERYLQKAFELSETNRNTTLLKGLQDAKFKLFGDIPADLLEIEKNIKQELELVKLDLHYEKTAKDPDKRFISDLLHQRIAYTNKLDSLHKTFEINFPRYKDLKYQNKIISLSEVQKNLDKNTQLITYFLGDKSLFTFNISNNKITFLKSEIADQIIDITNTFKSKLIARDDISEVGKKLHLYLLGQQLNKTKNNLVVIPDNVLNYIPFEILLNESGRSLIEDYTISYSGSVHLFLELKNDFFNYSSPNYWAGFSPIYQEDQKLSSNFNEVSAIAEIVDGKEFIGEASKKQSFLENNKDYSILHMAMHTIIDNEHPMYNKLIFSDGELSASEIYLSKTKANLAVLSACNTGFGKLEKGEGIMSMARAFHFSGVPSVIMSLWKVPDKETKKIMVSFYSHLEKGETKSEALKNAKLDYLANTDDISLKHPYYWAGFVLNGNSDTLKQSHNYLYLISSGLLFFGFLFWRIKSKPKKS